MEQMIKINEKLFIQADSNNYILVAPRGKDKEGKQIYITLGFYSSLSTLLDGIEKHELREYISKKEINSVSDLFNEVKKLEKLIQDFTKECKL